MAFYIRHDSVTVVTCAKFHCDRPNILWTRALLNFEFDQKFISGSSAWGPFYKWFSHWYSNAMQIVFAFIQMLIKWLLQNLRISNPNYSKKKNIFHQNLNYRRKVNLKIISFPQGIPGLVRVHRDIELAPWTPFLSINYKSSWSWYQVLKCSYCFEVGQVSHQHQETQARL